MIYLKTMNRLKKFWIVFLSFLPWAAGAAVPLLVGGIAGVGVLAGFSIYRTAVPVSPTDAYQFFSSCWTCQMFSDIMATMSGILPRIYHALGETIVPFTIMLTAIWLAWKLVSNLMNGKMEDGWSLTSTFVNHMVRLGIVCIFLLAPLPRLISDVAITPIFNIGMSLNRVVVHDDNFDMCVISTALADPVSVDSAAADSGAFSPTMRHNLACELAGIHQMTGMGMTVGWTMLNMAFDADYMHKILWDVPIFPNIILFFSGLLIMVLFFAALLPIPIYFLEIFITLSLDLVMLPFMLLAWLFQGWQISLAGAGKTIRGIIDDVINATFALAITGVFVTFAIMFLDAIFGDWNGVSVLSTALTQNDSKFMMDALMMRNDSLVTIILMGIFIAMFMIMIPALSKTLFNVQMSTRFYDTTKKNIEIVWENLKKWYSAIKK
ncbi:MAG: hypothetical protein E7011_03175 [Alphaproteobacteria bacterium]|nr:hypothetical protein [Alphaproteobacteria bacterium]